MYSSGKSSKSSTLVRAAARRKRYSRAACLEMLESRVLLTGAFAAADMAGTWTYSAMDEAGTIQLDASNTITGGSLQHDDGTTTVPTGTYTIASDGTVALTIDGATRTGAMNATREAMTVTTAGTHETLSVLVKRSGAIFSNSDLNGSWSMFINGDSSNNTGFGHIGFDGAGNISATGSVQTTEGTTTITGGTYAVASNGGVTMTINLLKPSGPSSIVLTGAINHDRNTLALNPTDLQAAATGDNTRLVTMVAQGGLYSKADFNGAWTIASDGVEGTLTFNGAGGITAGTVQDNHGNTDTVTGTYTVSLLGTFSMHLNLTQGLTHTSLTTSGTLNATRNLASMEQLPSAVAGSANSARSLMELVRAANRPPVFTRLATLDTAFAGQPFNITYDALFGSSNATDFDGDAVRFSVETLGTGTLTLNAAPVTVGQIISVADTLVWTPVAGMAGNLTAFGLKAFDGTAKSATTIAAQVRTVLPPTVNVTAGRSAASEINNGVTTGVGVFTVTRSKGDLLSALDVTVAVSGTATNGLDDAAIGTAVHFAAGQTSQKLNVVAVNDGLAEGTETVIVTVQPDATYSIGAGVAQLSILDSASTVSIAGPRQAALEATGQTTGARVFTLKRTGGSIAEALTVNYTIGGTAVAGTNYTALTGTATFEANQSTTTITVNPIDDATVDPTLTVTATLAPDAGPSYFINGLKNTATTNIQDDAATISITAARSPATETNGQTTGKSQFTLKRTGGPLTGTLTVNYTIGGTAVAGTNYTALTGTVTFGIGASSATIDVLPLADQTVDPTRTVVVTLVQDANPSYRINPLLGLATMNILDNSSAVSITAQKPSATELNGATTGFGQFKFQRAGGDLTQTLTVNYGVGGTAATDGSDYTTVLAGTVTFLPNVTSVLVNLNPVDDLVIEGTETVILTLAPDANPSYSINPLHPVATVSIVDHNRAPAFTTVGTLAGATQNTGFAISYATFLAATDAVDPESTAISFKITGAHSGTLLIDHGAGAVAVVPGVTLFGAGDTLTWTPGLNAVGSLNAFSVAATDGVNVTAPKVVTVTVA